MFLLIIAQSRLLTGPVDGKVVFETFRAIMAFLSHFLSLVKCANRVFDPLFFSLSVTTRLI